MPIPKVSAAETEEQYIGKCMKEIGGEYPQEQALAICYSTYRKENMKKIKDTNKKVMARIKYDADFKGINLAPLEKGEDDPCWSGYVQVGTKELDGKTVPNCVPLED